MNESSNFNFQFSFNTPFGIRVKPVRGFAGFPYTGVKTELKIEIRQFIHNPPKTVACTCEIHSLYTSLALHSVR